MRIARKAVSFDYYFQIKAVGAVTSLPSILLPIGQGIELSCVWRTTPS